MPFVVGYLFMGVTANSMRWQKLWQRGCWIFTVACCHCMFCKMLIAFIGRTPIHFLRENVGLLSFRCGGCICKVIISSESPPYSCKQRVYVPKVCGVHRYFLSYPQMTWFCFIPLVINFSSYCCRAYYYKLCNTFQAVS